MSVKNILLGIVDENPSAVLEAFTTVMESKIGTLVEESRKEIGISVLFEGGDGEDEENLDDDFDLDWDIDDEEALPMDEDEEEESDEDESDDTDESEDA